jgi:hypothetical protein
MPFTAEGYLEIIKGMVSKVSILARDVEPGFYQIKLCDGRILDHIAGKYLTFRSFSDSRSAPKRIDDAKTYPAHRTDAHRANQTLETQLTLW